MNDLKFKSLNENAILPTRNHNNDAGLDIYSLEDVEIPASQVDKSMIGIQIGRARIPTGISVEIPNNYYGKIVGRSGLAFNKDIICFEGTIDSPYRGELGVLLYNLTSRPYLVRKGDRVAQLIIQKCELLNPIFVENLGFGTRGDNGLGSSGR